MRRDVICVESLETRRMLAAALEVWASNNDLRVYGDANSLFMNIDQEGTYTKIGETNLANSSVSFSNSQNYKFFVVAARGRVEIDSIAPSSGGSISGINRSSNTDNNGAAIGAPNGVFAIDGNQVSEGTTFAGYMLVVAPSTWQGLTIQTGSVEPMFRFNVDQDQRFMPGTTSPYAVRADMYVRFNGLIEAARVHTKAGKWMDLDANGQGELSWESFYANKAAADSELGDGTYTLWMQTAVGERTIQFDASDISYPTQIPSTTSFTHGGTNTPTAFDIAGPAPTDPSITQASLTIRDRNDEDVYNNWISPGETLPTVYLAADQSYVASLTCGVGTGYTTPLGYQFNYSKSNETGYVFGTTGFVQGTPDLRGVSVTSPTQTVNPGDAVSMNIAVTNTGGMAYAPGQPVHHLIGLSMNKIVGDADDVVLYNPVEAGHPDGWTTTGDMSMRVPDTAPAGQYFVFGAMDYGNVVAESNESNNIGWSTTAAVTIAPQAITYDPAVRRISIAGTSGNDNISLTVDALTLYANINGAYRSYARSSVDSIYVDGAAGDDLITAGDGIAGATLRGGEGNDTIGGGNGDDWIYGDNGNDSLAGNDGYDTVFGNFGDDVIAGGFRRDSLSGGLGNDTITGGDGPDAIFGGDGTDVLRGGKGADWIEGRGKSDTIYGGLGNDSLFGGAGPDAIYGEDGDDTIDVAPASVFRDTVDGGLGYDLGLYDSDDLVIGMEGLLA